MAINGELELHVISPSRKKVRPGDVFAMKFTDDVYLFGRVVKDDAFWTPSGESAGLAILIYIYSHIGKSKDDFDGEDLGIERLLVPPMMTNRLGWSRGYFTTVQHFPLDETDLLERHVFENRPGQYFDESGHEVNGWDGPIGVYGLASYRTIQQVVLDALGLQR